MWTEVHASALTSVFDALNASGIKWMVLRNHEGLPQYNRSKDIDLILKKSDFAQAKQVVGKALEKQGFSQVDNFELQYVSCNTYFHVSDSQNASIKIDFLDGFVWRGAQVFEFDSLYEKRVAYNNFFIPDKVSDAFMLWIKPLMTGGFVKEKYRADILAVLATDPEQFRVMLVEKFGDKVANELWPLLSSKNLDATVAYQRTLCHSAWYKHFLSWPFQTLLATVLHFYTELLHRLKRNRGTLLAVVGPDGVGKTTFIELLRKELANVLVKDDSAITVPHFRPNIFPNIKELVGGKSYDPATEEFHNPHRAKPAGVASSFARMGYYWLDYFLGYWLVIRRKCARGNVFIFDRYIYDFVVDPRRSRINLPLAIRKAFQVATPQPDLVFFLDCDADIVYARKQELKRDEIDRQLGVYRQMANKYPERFVRLDARKAPEESCRLAVRQVVERSFPSI